MPAAESDPRWALLDAARTSILDRLTERGVQRVEFVAAFGRSDEVWVWLGTTHDAERDALGNYEPCLDEVREAFASVGYPGDQLVNVHSTAQSQETVDRDYESSWFYALR